MKTGIWEKCGMNLLLDDLEKNIGYCESHDQALVGDKTIIFG